MKRFIKLRTLVYGAVLSGLAFLALPAAAQPSVSAVINAANADTTSLARGSFISIFGKNLGTQAGPPSALPLPTSMGSATVNIKPASGSNSYQAYLQFVSPAQINAIIPSAVPAGPADVTVTVNNVTSSARRIQVAESAFGIFTIGSQAAGMAIAQNYESATSLPLNLYTNAAHPGQTLILWGTGLGAYTAGSDGDAPQAGNIVNNAQVILAGTSITPFYAGRAPGIPGVDQINFTIPDSVPIPDGCSLEVQVQIGDQIQNGIATIAKSSNGPVCQHPFALSQDQLTALETGSTLNGSIVQILRNFAVEGLVNGAPLGFTAEEIQVGFRKFAANGSPLTNQGYPFSVSQAPGTCNVVKATGQDFNFVDHIDVDNLLSSPVDAGSNFSLSGPAGTMSVNSDGITTLAQGSTVPGVPNTGSFLQDGNFTLAVSGGSDVGAFQAKFILQNQFNANFPSNLTKGQPLTLTWTGGNDGDVVRIFVTGVSFSGANPLVTCTANTTDHTFTIPGALTGQLVSDQPIAILGFYATSAPISFSAALVKGGSLDSGKIVTGVLETLQSLPLQ